MRFYNWFKSTNKINIITEWGLDANILVQELIKEAKGADIRCFVIGGKVIAAMKRQSAEGDETQPEFHLVGWCWVSLRSTQPTFLSFVICFPMTNVQTFHGTSVQ
nr:hypothetical protein [Dactylococcopsis salina]